VERLYFPYHISQYLAKAAKSCAPDDIQTWLETQKQRLKNNDYQDALSYLKACLKSDGIKGDKVAVQKCYQYKNKRINHIDYKGALKKGLPIGSGEIVSALRYNPKPNIIQQLLCGGGMVDDGHFKKYARSLGFCELMPSGMILGTVI